MKNKICPKCNASEIYTNVEARLINRNRLSFDAWVNPVPLNIYMCMNCGYLEYYVARREDREKVARKWPKVN